MYKRVLVFFECNNLLSPNQYGFRSGRSAVHAMLDFYNDFYNDINKDPPDISLGIFLDLKKAFDTVSHDLLLNKLQHYGIRGIPFDWFTSYFNNRRQYVVMNGVESTTHKVDCGVPQGSILELLLFLIYVNDLPLCCSFLKPVLFADDTTLFASGRDLIRLGDAVNTDLLIVQDWFRAKNLL